MNSSRLSHCLPLARHPPTKASILPAFTALEFHTNGLSLIMVGREDGWLAAFLRKTDTAAFFSASVTWGMLRSTVVRACSNVCCLNYLLLAHQGYNVHTLVRWHLDIGLLRTFRIYQAQSRLQRVMMVLQTTHSSMFRNKCLVVQEAHLFQIIANVSDPVTTSRRMNEILRTLNDPHLLFMRIRFLLKYNPKWGR